MRLLGSEMNHFSRNLYVRGSVDLISGSLSLAGNAAYGGGAEEAVLCVSTYDNTVSAAIFTIGTITVYSEYPDYNSQSLCIKDWITHVSSGHRDHWWHRRTGPDGVLLKTGTPEHSRGLWT
jgi:hypothetical protein